MAGGDPATVCVTVDAEQDVPPFLSSWRGMEEGFPILLDILDEAGVGATIFTTGETARRFPRAVRDLVDRGHEVGCHGMTHRPFPDLSRAEAEQEIIDSSEILRRFAPVTSFRAPYLRFPESYLDILEAQGFTVDSSRGRYKPAHWMRPAPSGLTRVPASISSSWLRLPRALRDLMLVGLQSPVVLFVHPWEFVDLRSMPIRWDCRAGTGAWAQDSLLSALNLFRNRGARFLRMRSLAGRRIR